MENPTAAVSVLGRDPPHNATSGGQERFLVAASQTRHLHLTGTGTRGIHDTGRRAAEDPFT